MAIVSSILGLKGSKWRAVDVAASQSAITLQVSAGAEGDFLLHLEITPETTSPGAVTLTNGSGSAIIIFPGGANSVSNLVPFPYFVHACSVGGAWKVTTGTNVHIKATGLFS